MRLRIVLVVASPKNVARRSSFDIFESSDVRTFALKVLDLVFLGLRKQIRETYRRILNSVKECAYASCELVTLLNTFSPIPVAQTYAPSENVELHRTPPICFIFRQLETCEYNIFVLKTLLCP